MTARHAARFALAMFAAPSIVLAGSYGFTPNAERPDFPDSTSVATDLIPTTGTSTLAIAGPASPSAPALRVPVVLIPPVSVTAPALTFTSDTYGNVCVGALAMLDYYSPGWDSWRMATIMYRESRCLPWVPNPKSSATGLLQVLASHCAWLVAQMLEPCTRERLTDAEYNIRAAAVLWTEQGYGAWSL